MDFSRFSPPSKQWLDLEAKIPAMARVGHEIIALDEVVAWREAGNKADEKSVAEAMVSTGLIDQVDATTLYVPSTHSDYMIPVRRYAPRAGRHAVPADKPSTMLHFTGGGWIMGTEKTVDLPCSRLAAALGIVVFSGVYRRLPEHKDPVQRQDAWDIYSYLREHASEVQANIENGIGLIGSSGGGTLVASIIQRDLDLSRSTPDYTSKIVGAVMQFPVLCVPENFPYKDFVSRDKVSYEELQDVPYIPRPRMNLLLDLIRADPQDHLMNVITQEDEAIRHWPKTAIIVPGRDPIRDHGLYFAKRLEAVG
jgi:acetyl esterase